MRKKKWARPELAACPWYIQDTEAMRGQWKSLYPADSPLHIELGCGKGVSTAQMAHDNPDINYLAIDISPDVLGECKRNIERAYAGAPVDNIRLARFDISVISRFLAEEDAAERIYISFCNPWPRRRHQKRRLTHPRQLVQYRTFLSDGGEIWFKTDDTELFEDSLEYFSACGFEPVFVTEDLSASGFTPNYISEHEEKFTAQGLPIHFGRFRKAALPDGPRAAWPEEEEDP